MTENRTTSDDHDRPPVRRRVRPIIAAAPPARKLEPTAQDSESASTMATQYKVGYGKPPKHSQFKAGFDPRRARGRKPHSQNKANTIVEMMESPTVVRTPEGGVRTIATAEAMARKLRELGLSGSLPAIIKAFELYLKYQPPVLAGVSPIGAEPEVPITATDLAILEELKADLLAEAQGAAGAKKSERRGRQ